jgi:hypothetical protein
MKKNVLIGCSFAFTLLTAACGEHPTAPAAVAPAGSDLAGVTVLPELGRSRESLLSGLPSGHTLVNYAARAINPDDYACSPTELDGWFSDEIAPIISDPVELAIAQELLGLLADVLPLYEAAFILDGSSPQEFGYEGQYTNLMERTDRDVRRFWDIGSDGIQLIAMKGSMLLDVDRVTRVYVEVFGLPETLARSFAERVAELIAASEVLDGGNHALFVFNAFAVQEQPGIPADKIVMGDATFAFYETLGFGDVAVQGVYAHEFAHHIQFDNGYFNDLDPSTTTAPERTRYTELMADAMAAYYLTHKRGAALNKHRVAEFFQVFFEIGDCAFTNSGHHGTPNQRMAAAEWGFALADAAQKQGHILSAEAVHALFVEAYPDLIAPDAL